MKSVQFLIRFLLATAFSEFLASAFCRLTSHLWPVGFLRLGRSSRITVFVAIQNHATVSRDIAGYTGAVKD